MASIKTIGIVGTGVIGSSWTGLFLAKGYHVIVADPAHGAEEKLAKFLRSIWPTLETLGLEEGATLKNYRFVGESLGKHYGEVDFIQENAPEQVDLKVKLLEEIDAAVHPEVIIASSSSGLPSSSFTGRCLHPERVLIGHPFNPPHIMPLVEVVPSPQTNQKTIRDTMELYRKIGRKPVLVKEEIPGFIVNRLQAALVNEAFSLVSRNIISAEDLDLAVTGSLGPRWASIGPFLAIAMGGGGGIEGFKGLLQHLGPASKAWVEDMKAHPFSGSMEEAEALCQSVEEELQGQDIERSEQQRDAILLAILGPKRSLTV